MLDWLFYIWRCSDRNICDWSFEAAIFRRGWGERALSKRYCPFPTFPRRRMSVFDVGQLSEQTQRKDTVFCAISLALTGNYRHRGRNTKKSRRFACSWESELRAIVFFPTEMGPLRWFRWLFVSFIVGMQMRSFAFTQDEFVKAVRFAHLNVKCREMVQYCGLFACVVCLIT